MLKNILLVGAGGFAGSIFRYLFYIWLEKERNFPLATFTVNMTGSLLLGIFMGYYLARLSEPDYLRLLFAVGFCGSFTTFSTFAYENYNLFTEHQATTAIGYSLASVILGLGMIYGGILIGRAL